MKNALDWFKFDVHLDDKFALVEAEFGLTGFAVVVKLFQKIYGGEGYYCEWTNEVALLFGRACGTGGSVVSEIVSASIKRGIFDKGMYERYGVLTSAGIQKRYLEAVNRRLNSDIKNEYLLVNCTQKSKDVNISNKNVYISEENDDIPKQSREDKIRVDKSRVDYKEIIDFFHETCVSYPRITAVSDKRQAAIKARLNKYTVDDFKRMFEKAEASDFLKGANKNNWRANFDWLICDSNFAKVLDGNYDNRSGGGSKYGSNIFAQIEEDIRNGKG